MDAEGNLKYKIFHCNSLHVQYMNCIPNTKITNIYRKTIDNRIYFKFSYRKKTYNIFGTYSEIRKIVKIGKLQDQDSNYCLLLGPFYNNPHYHP